MVRVEAVKPDICLFLILIWSLACVLGRLGCLSAPGSQNLISTALGLRDNSLRNAQFNICLVITSNFTNKCFKHTKQVQTK